MYRLISKEWRYDGNGRPIKRHVYMAKEPVVLPPDAPLGSRAVFYDGSILTKTAEGWKRRDEEKCVSLQKAP